MDAFNCPITYARMRDPVIAMDGHTYERMAIERWIAENVDRVVLSPLTGIPMGRLLIPNYTLKKAIEEYDQPLIHQAETQIRNDIIQITLNNVIQDINNNMYDNNNIHNIMKNLNDLNYINQQT